ncbi:MAG TPA: hypothetical protein VKR83_20150 [Ktedonobacteraceae bacterium]|nr:hypothetical protein [Ktedonobacteraceae bacterium]
MDIYERAMQYTGMIERVMPEMSRSERARRVLMLVEADFKQASGVQGISKQAVRGGQGRARGLLILFSYTSRFFLFFPHLLQVLNSPILPSKVQGLYFAGLSLCNRYRLRDFIASVNHNDIIDSGIDTYSPKEKSRRT